LKEIKLMINRITLNVIALTGCKIETKGEHNV
jgi:hypothetical protein